MLGQELRRQDQRNKTVLRRRTSIFTAALELKKLRAQGGALHYRVWDPQSGVDTSWQKSTPGPFDYVPGSGSKPHTKPAPVPRFRWRQRADDEGLPYYVDAKTGDTVRAAPEAWVAFTRQRGDNLPTGVVRRVGSICEYLDEKSGRVYYHDSETSSTAWARPSAFADEEDRAHAVAPRSPNRLGGLRNALRRRAAARAAREAAFDHGAAGLRGALRQAAVCRDREAASRGILMELIARRRTSRRRFLRCKRRSKPTTRRRRSPVCHRRASSSRTTWVQHLGRHLLRDRQPEIQLDAPVRGR